MKTEWDLERYFYKSIEDEQLQADLQLYMDKADVCIEKYSGKIAELSDEEFLCFLEDIDALNVDGEKVMVYLGLVSSMDTQDQDVQKKISKISKMLSKYSEKFLFIDEEYKLIGFRKFEYFSSLGIMAPFKNYLRNTGISIQYLLSEPEEKVVIKLANAYGTNLYEELVTSFKFNFRGENLTEDEIRTLRESQDRSIRRDAFQALADMYLTTQNQIVLGTLYSLVCKDNVADVELRKFDTVMSDRNMSEELSDKTVDTLLNTVSSKFSLHHEFLGKKAKILGYDKLENHDIYAPFPSDVEEPKFTFEEGWELYKNTIEKVDPKLYEFSDDMVESGRISVHPKQNKSSGAYAQYTKNLSEFVLLNWANTVSDVSTLAHELGHAFHGSLSKEQKSLVYHTPLTLAETASIFNETLMFETILDKTEDKLTRKKLICNRLDDIFGTIFRQVVYVLFERRCHESFKNNEPLTYEDYNNMWFEEMEKFIGPNVNLNKDLMKHGWSSIPHIFHTPFYCYTYAFGNIISLNIYQKYKDSDNKEEFITKYHKLLESGGSDTPENLLNDIFGIKFDESFYNLAFTNIEELIKKLDE